MNKLHIYYDKKQLFWDIIFGGWLASEYIMPHTAISMLLLVLFCGWGFLHISFRSFYVDKSLLLYLVFVLVCILSIKQSIMPSLSIKMVRTLIINIIFMYCALIYFLYSDINHIKNVLVFSAVSISFFAIICSLITSGSIFFRKGSSLNPNILAVFDSIIMCWIYATDKKRKDYYIMAFLFVFCVLTGTRKAFITMAVGIFLYIMVKKPSKLVLNIFIVIVVSAFGLYAMKNVPILYENIGYRFETLFAMLQGGTGAGSEMTRQKYIELGLLFFKEKPILGYGIDTFRILPGSYGVYSHNNYIELLFGTGLVGTISYYYIFINLLAKSIKIRIKTDSTLIVLAISFLATIFITDYAMVSYFERTSLLVFVIIVCLFNNVKRGLEEEV